MLDAAAAAPLALPLISTDPLCNRARIFLCCCFFIFLTPLCQHDFLYIYFFFSSSVWASVCPQSVSGSQFILYARFFGPIFVGSVVDFFIAGTVFAVVLNVVVAALIVQRFLREFASC